MTVYRLDFGYDGSGFHGFARNAGVRTIQGEIEDAITTVTGESIPITVAGRTDAGVHARGQVVSFEADGIEPEGLERSLRKLLAPEIAIRAVREVEGGFDARFSATSRMYRYRVDDAAVPDPLQRQIVWHVGRPLDIAAMNEAASAFIGTHDFASLCRSQEGRSTERTVLRAGWERRDDGLVYEVEATAFCHQMVRSMVGLCVDVGLGRIEAGEVPAILAARDRNRVGRVAPPHGLVLAAVAY